MSSTHAPRRPSRKAARIVGVGVIAGGMVASAALVWGASYSAFSATTTNPTDNWSAGTVGLTDDDQGQALFTASDLKPGSSGSKCIVVTSTGSLASAVKMYATPGSFEQTRTLADHVQLTITQGTGGSGGGDCTSFVADTGTGTTDTGTISQFAARYTDFADGFGTWATSVASSARTPVQKTYRIDYVLTAGTTQAETDAMQGGTAAVGFTWEAQNS